MDIEKSNKNNELLFMLKQQRALYYQLKNLAVQQQEVFNTSNSPQELVRILIGRRKLIDKLRQINFKVKTIKSNWSSIADKLTMEEKKIAKTIAQSINQIILELKSVDFVYEQSQDILGDTAQFAVNLVSEIETVIE